MDEVAHEDITLYHHDNKVSLPIYKDKLQKGVVAPSHVIIYVADKALRICFAVILKNHTTIATNFNWVHTTSNWWDTSHTTEASKQERDWRHSTITIYKYYYKLNINCLVVFKWQKFSPYQDNGIQQRVNKQYRKETVWVQFTK